MHVAVEPRRGRRPAGERLLGRVFGRAGDLVAADAGVHHRDAVAVGGAQPSREDVRPAIVAIQRRGGAVGDRIAEGDDRLRIGVRPSRRRRRGRTRRRSGTGTPPPLRPRPSRRRPARSGFRRRRADEAPTRSAPDPTRLDLRWLVPPSPEGREAGRITVASRRDADRHVCTSLVRLAGADDPVVLRHRIPPQRMLVRPESATLRCAIAKECSHGCRDQHRRAIVHRWNRAPLRPRAAAPAHADADRTARPDERHAVHTSFRTCSTRLAPWRDRTGGRIRARRRGAAARECGRRQRDAHARHGRHQPRRGDRDRRAASQERNARDLARVGNGRARHGADIGRVERNRAARRRTGRGAEPRGDRRHAPVPGWRWHHRAAISCGRSRRRGSQSRGAAGGARLTGAAGQWRRHRRRRCTPSISPQGLASTSTSASRTWCRRHRRPRLRRHLAQR